MLPNQLPPVPGSVHKKKRVGRGNASGHGTYSGRGIKGQKSRTGRDLRIGFEGGQIPLVRALSRKRGFNNRFRVEYEPVNVEALGRFESGASVNVATLREAGLVKSSRLPVKVLGDGELTVKLTVEAERFSASARQKIEAAGGTVVELSPAPAKEAAATIEARRGGRPHPSPLPEGEGIREGALPEGEGTREGAMAEAEATAAPQAAAPARSRRPRAAAEAEPETAAPASATEEAGPPSPDASEREAEP